MKVRDIYKFKFVQDIIFEIKKMSKSIVEDEDEEGIERKIIF